MKKVLFAAVAVMAAALTGVVTVGSDAGSDTRPAKYIVLYEQGASPAAVKLAVKQAKGRILRANNKVGVATAISANSRFRGDAEASKAIKGVARNIPIGRAKPSLRPKLTPEQLNAFRRASRGTAAQKSSGSGYLRHSNNEPLADLRADDAHDVRRSYRGEGPQVPVASVLDQPARIRPRPNTLAGVCGASPPGRRRRPANDVRVAGERVDAGGRDRDDAGQLGRRDPAVVARRRDDRRCPAASPG